MARKSDVDFETCFKSLVGNRHQTVVVEDQVVDDDGKTVATESPKMTYEEGVERLKKLSHQIKELGLYDEIIEACNKHDLAGLNKITEKYDKEVHRICNQMDQIMKQMPYPYSYYSSCKCRILSKQEKGARNLAPLFI